MASSRDHEHFALDWIKSDLLETLNQARVALDDYAEQGEDETRLRSCLTNLHQLHGTLLMLELEGITLLADHLEQAAQKLMLGEVRDPAACSQSLMQGILEMPGYLDELQRGAEDKVGVFIPLVNEIRALLDMEPLADRAGKSLNAGASDESILRFMQLDGQTKVTRMRSAYQSVLLSILKGDDRAKAIVTLEKIALGLQKLTAGSSMERQWQAFGEFVNSLATKEGALESDAVKLLRRVDVEIKGLASDGESALKRPANLDLIQSLLDATDAQAYASETVSGLREAVERDSSHNTLAISGRQALATAALALSDELAVIKDKLDLLARAPSLDLDALRELTSPLGQIGSTLSLLGFESSREIIANEIKAVENIVVLGDADPAGIQSVAAALAQVDENLNSVSTERSEIEQITGDAQLQLLREAGKGLEAIKSAVVDFVTAHWDVRHLESIPQTIREICGALDIIPLPRVTTLLGQTNSYVETKLLQGHQPEWQELDQFADVISGIDYFLERLAEENTQGMGDILLVAERSLDELLPAGETQSVEDHQQEAVGQTIEPESSDVDAEATVDEVEDPIATADIAAAEVLSEDTPEDIAVAEVSAESIDETAIDTAEEVVELALDEDASFDLSGAVFADLEGVVEKSAEEITTEEVTEEGTIEQPIAADEEILAEELSAEEINADEITPEVADVEEIAAADTAIAPAARTEQPIEFDGEPPDAEIVEIFLEEVDEVLETIDEHLPHWAIDHAANSEALTEVRRAFHTLKGSGRIVQAVEIGELAWCIENMLNRVIDGTVTATPQFDAIIREARDLVPGLASAFERQVQGDHDAIAQVIERADVLASGGAVEDTSAMDAESANDRFENLEFVGQEATHQEEVEQTSEADVAATPDEEIFDVASLVDSIEGDAQDSFAQQPVLDEEVASVNLASESESVAKPDPAAEPVDEALELFKDEVLECIGVLVAEQNNQPWSLSEPIRRTLHTLAGSAAAAQAEPIRFIVGPANQVVEVFRESEALDGLKTYFDAVIEELKIALEQLGDANWEEPVELVAQADDLIALGISKPDPVGNLLAAPATEALFSNEDKLAAILTGEQVATDLLSALTDLVGLAGKAEQFDVAELAAALLRTVTTASISGGVHATARNAISGGYSILLDQLNSLVAGGSVAPSAEHVQHLDNIDFAAEPETPAANVAEALAEEVSQELVDDLAGEVQAEAGSEAEPELVSDAEPEIPDLADLEIDADLIEVFFEEADEINEELETTMMEWSQEPDNRLYLENILRGLHTLKGGARLCGLMQIGEMAHNFESVVIEVQNNERDVDDALFKDLHARFDGVVEQLALVKQALFETDTPAEETPVEDAPVVSASQDATREVDQAETSTGAEELQPEFDLASLSFQTEEHEKEPETELVELVNSPEPTLPQPMVAEASAKESANDRSEPAVEKVERSSQEMVRVGAGLLEELVNLAGENSILRARIEQGMSDFTGALDEMETTIERVREQLRRLEIETETQVLHRREREDGPQYEEFDPLEMDRYSQLQQLSRGLSESASDMLDLKDTLLFKARESETLLLQQARINTELQEGLMRTRMVPFNRLMPRLRRIVRQVSGELSKEVEFHVQNAEGELDRNLLERMVPPLEHMLRNAVDHGIELPSERRNFGKAASGRIDLRLSREGGDVVIEISDDGAGIDVESVRAKAIEKEMCTAESNLSNEEVMQFVLAPGFSTAKSVTQISGRGVGMDVVHSEVKQLGGSIHISSTIGRGTRFVVRVPFTVSVNRALMVSVAEDLYAIPLNTIEGIVLLNPEELEKFQGKENATFEYAGVPYRMRYLGQYLGRDYHGPQVGQTSVPVVLVRSGDHAVAIHVDAVQGSREIVVKSLGPQFAGVGGISGATILGDGSVVVILDLHALIRAQRQFGKQANNDRVGLGRPRCVMVVDDSVTVRKVTSRLLERQGMDVMVAKDGVEAVALLQERRPDVMLLDIEMPRMDGFEVARQVRHDDRLDNLPIVMISSRTGEKHKEHADQLGVNKFLGKPFQENELLATIDELVTRM